MIFGGKLIHIFVLEIRKIGVNFKRFQLRHTVLHARKSAFFGIGVNFPYRGVYPRRDRKRTALKTVAKICFEKIDKEKHFKFSKFPKFFFFLL